MRQSFEKELAWCIEQLERGLTGAKKSNEKQIKEGVKVLKVKVLWKSRQLFDIITVCL